MRLLLPLLALLLCLPGCPRRGAPSAGLAPAPSPGARGEELVEGFTDEQLIALLGALGYSPREVDEGTLTFELSAGRVLLFNTFGGDLQLFFVMTGGLWAPGEINEWNRTRRLTRAYLDTDGDLVLEADLLALAGITERQVASFVAVFERALALFVSEVAASGIGRPDPRPEPESSTPDIFH